MVSPEAPQDRRAAAIARIAALKKEAKEHELTSALNRIGALLKYPDLKLDELELAEAALGAPERTRKDTVRFLGISVLDRGGTPRPSPREAMPRVPTAVIIELVRASANKTFGWAALASRLQALRSAHETKRSAAIRELLELKNKPSLANVFNSLVPMLRKLPASAHPHPIHRGEPYPIIGAWGYARVGLFIALRDADEPAPIGVAPKDRALFDDLVSTAQSYINGSRLSAAAIERAVKLRSISMAATFARAAIMEARNAARQSSNLGRNLSLALEKAGPIWLSKGGEASTRRRIESVDDELRRLDIVNALQAHNKQSTSPIAVAVFRGERLWLAQLESGAFGLLSKIGARWSWLEGPREEVVGSVPDTMFEAATEAALASRISRS